MMRNLGAAPLIETEQDALDLVSLLFARNRPAADIAATIDRHLDLLPVGFAKARDHLLKGNIGAAQSAMRVAHQPDNRS